MKINQDYRRCCMQNRWSTEKSGSFDARTISRAQSSVKYIDTEIDHKKTAKYRPMPGETSWKNSYTVSMTFLLDWSDKKCTERELWQRHRYVFPDIKINFSCQLYLLLLLAAAKDAAPRDVGEDDGGEEENDGHGDHSHGDVHDVSGTRLQGDQRRSLSVNYGTYS